MEIEYVTHASLMVRSEAFRLLTDPFYFFDDGVRDVMCHFPPRPLHEEDFGRLDFVYSSHVHPDHSHPATLSRLRDRIDTVLLPAERPELETRYRDLGFRDVVLLESGKTLQLRDGLGVTSFWDGPVDSVLVVEGEGRTLLHQNDCRLKMRTVAEMAERFRIDYAFLNYTWIQDPYPLLLPRPDEELTRLVEQKERDCLAYQLGCVDLLAPRIVVPYSMTMTYFQPDQIHLNGYGRMTPPIFAKRLRERRGKVECWTLQPGDVIDTESDRVRRFRVENLWGDDLDEYLRNVAHYSQSHREQLPPFVLGDADACDATLKAHFVERLRLPFLPFLAGRRVGLRVVGDRGERRYALDLRQREIQELHEPVSGENGSEYLRITIPASTLLAILERAYDPFSALFSYRIRFQLRGAHDLPGQDEVWMYILSLISLFRPDLQEEVMEQRAV